eukprot:gnl/Trimastix_PCT/3041.p2 GENE.gnl/Trimastix_PCT/3041~~gnl/Trimastix_PCT/3041.p2  ORF type:complete len:369 (+),score=75.71 gnl/Trimastix_PCT/3041:58-1164(+)
MSASEQPIILDNGSCTIKAGYAGDEMPTECIRSIVGRPRKLPGMEVPDAVYFGDEALANRSKLRLNYPIEYGIIFQWEQMESLWRHVLDDHLHKDPRGKHVFLTEAIQNPFLCRKRMTEIMFETFGVSHLLVRNTPTLALYATGRTTGFVIECGDAVMHAGSVYEGYALPHTFNRLDLGGREVTDQLVRAFDGTTSAPFEAMKKQCCYVAASVDAEEDRLQRDPDSVHMDYALPDGRVVTAGEERFMAPEVIFTPSRLGRSCGGLADHAATAFFRTPLELRAQVARNMVLAGGSSLFPGMGARLEKNLAEVFPEQYRVVVHEPPKCERAVLAWIGGSILASLESSAPLWMTAAEYEESGPDLSHRKFV